MAKMGTAAEIAAIVAELLPPPPAWYWVACTDGERHAVLGVPRTHEHGDAITGMCGADTAFGRPNARYRYPFQWSHCAGCKEAAREFLAASGR